MATADGQMLSTACIYYSICVLLDVVKYAEWVIVTYETKKKLLFVGRKIGIKDFFKCVRCERRLEGFDIALTHYMNIKY